ncbi:MAG: hypothetical protein L0215_12615 [Gemmataceae bacterium]|nr:hypothetical protein [Gemmataceae bacterium]
MWTKEPALARAPGGWFYNYFWWIILALLVAQALDTFFTLQAFAKKEAEQALEDDDDY